MEAVVGVPKSVPSWRQHLEQYKSIFYCTSTIWKSPNSG